MAEQPEPRTGDGLSWRAHAPRRMAVAVRTLLATGAAVVLVLATLTATPDGAFDWVAFLILSGLGIASRFISGRHAVVSIPGALIFVGAAAVVLPPSGAVWVAALVGLAGIARGDRAPRVVDSLSTLVLSTAAASYAGRAAPRILSDDRTVIGTQGELQVGTALVIGVALALSWQVLRWIAAWIDRRASSASWRVHNQIRWLRDLTFAAAAILAGVVWLLYPPLILLVLIPLLSVWRFVDGSALGGSQTGADELTRTARAGTLRITLAEELARSARFDRPMSVLVADVDGMSKLNQRFGHEAGDAVMREVADRMRAVARDYDLVARIGGDSFALLLPETDRAGARIVAERVRELVNDDPVPVSTATRPLDITVSLGISTFPGDAGQREELLTEAELAASYAKMQGGGRVAEAAKLPPGFRGAATTGRGGDQILSRMVTAHGADAVEAEADRASMSVGPTLGAQDGEQLVRVSGEPLDGPRPRTDRLLSAAVVAAGLFGALAIWNEPGVTDLGRLVLFAAIAVAAEWFAESIYGRANSSWAAVPLIALAVTDALPAAVLLAAVSTAIGGGVLRALRPRQVLFNASVLSLATLAASGIAGTVIPLIDRPAILALFLGGLVGGAAFFAVDTWLVATAVGLATRSSVLEVWREDLAWLIPHQIGMGVLGGVMAYAHLTLDIAGTLVLVLPALGLHFAQRQFVSRTRDHVVRLRTLNDDLQHANTRVNKVNERLTDALSQVNNGYLVTVESLAAAVDAKDSYTGSHIDRVEAFGRKLLEVLDPELSDDEALLWGFRLHDVGKIGVPDSVLLKPGPLDDAEWDMMKRHPEIGAQIVSAAPFLQGARDVILHHHERWDGRGYPFGLRESAIPFSARVFSCIDAFDAMTSDRPYRKALPMDRAMQELLKHAGTQFDPEVIEAFVQIDLDDLVVVRERVSQDRGERHARAGGLLIPIADPYERVVGGPDAPSSDQAAESVRR